MKRFLPKTMIGQTILVLLVGLSLSHIISMMIYSSDRLNTLAVAGGQHMVRRIANVSRLVIGSPDNWQLRIVETLNEPNFRVLLTPEAVLVSKNNNVEQENVLANVLRQHLELGAEVPVLIQFLKTEHSAQNENHTRGVGQMSDMARMSGMGRMSGMMSKMGSRSHQQALRASIEIEPGKWLNFITNIDGGEPPWINVSVISILVMSLAVILLSIWVVRQLSTPLSTFADAAKRLGLDVNAPSMAVSGPLEVREAAVAFNDMQRRLKRLIDNRTQLLAAISHDLRTPITLLKLRAEAVDDLTEQAKILSTLDDMEQMIQSTLQFSRQEAEVEKEQRRTVDLGALIDAICADMADAGLAVEFQDFDKILLECRPQQLKRAIVNIIENAIKYGDRAEVKLIKGGHDVDIIVDDNGPGIAADQMDNVFQPFFRCETSRNRHTGGVGLGLSIAQSVAHAHGGEIKLENLKPQGLRVCLHLPL